MKNILMNLLNLLILIVLIITIEPFISFVKLYVLNNGLVFIKPENLTKTELIEKFKDLSSSKTLKEFKKDEVNKDKNKITIKDFLKTYYSKISNFIIKYKNLISFMNKIALFTILMKYFRKIKLLGFLFRIINYIILSTFGIFISDIYGLKEIILQIEYYWMKYVNFIHENKIYKILVKIFNVINDENKSDVIKDNSEVIENKSEVIGDKSNNDSKINNSELPSSGRTFSKEKINDDKISTGDEKENWFELKTYFLIGISIISLGLIYIYWDSINELFKNIKPDDDGNTTSGSPIFLSHEEEYEKYFKEKSTNEELYDLEIIRSADKTKIIDYSDVENTKWEGNQTTPKASSSKLPERNPVMIPISKK